MSVHYSDRFKCVSCFTMGKPKLNESCNIDLPPEAMDGLINAGYVFQKREKAYFTIKNIKNGAEACVGILECTMPSKTVCLPQWLMEYLQCQDNDLVIISLTTLPTATSVVFQPLSSTFFDIPNFLVVLEYSLRQHPCLNRGSIIIIEFCDKIYKLKVLKTEPQAMVKVFRDNVNLDVAPAIDGFTHKWNEPDIDSDEEEVKPIIKVGKTLSGQINEIVLDPEPIHSTFAKRQKELLAGMTFRTRQIVDGKEIRPPKLPEEKKEEKQNYLEGKGRKSYMPKKKKSKKKDVENNADNSDNSDNVEDEKPKSQPQEQIKTDSDQKISKTPVAPKKIEKPNSQPNNQPNSQPKSNVKSPFFTGESRSLSRQSVAPPPKPANVNNEKEKNDNDENSAKKKSFFEGKGRKLSE